MSVDVRDGQAVLTMVGEHNALTIEHDDTRSYEEIERAFTSRGYVLKIGVNARSGHRAWVLGARSMTTRDVTVTKSS